MTKDTDKEKEIKKMTVRDLFVTGCCFGTHTIFSIDSHNSDCSKWENIYSGCWGDMPENIRDKEVKWFDIWHDIEIVTISVERG